MRAIFAVFVRQSSRGNRVRKLASGVIAIARLRQHELRWQKIASLGSKTRRLLELHGREKAGNENAVVKLSFAPRLIRRSEFKF